MFTLKNYQETTLDFLEQYLNAARIIGAKAAFEKVAGENSGVIFRAYQPLSDAIYETPYVCLRLPTGGGKTLLATYAIQKAAQSYMDTDCPVVLWVVPTSTIKEQTLNALRTPGHPYRDALEENFDNRFRVLDISEFTQLRPQDLKSKTNIIVSTFAAYRVDVDNEEKRKVYAHHEELEPHFSKFPNLGNGLDTENGKVKHSFINLLHLHRPLVIVDEAHNHKSPLSIACVEKINPACIVEFTATPAEDSNILHNVSASELKSEEMIKLPIELTEHETWREAIHASVQTRQKLHELAEQDKEYIRPIVLLQAEKVNQDVTVEVIENYLMEEEGIDRSRIAIATGKQKELDGVDLFDRKSNIEFVITVEALKEGWDCSFAYVLCSVASKRSTKDVEQILGRVLRMPYANKRVQDELNRAYAHVSSPTWKNAAAQIHDRLVDMGFDEKEAQESIRLQRPVPQKDFFFGYDNAGMELPVCRFVAEKAPDLKGVAPEEQSKIEIKPLPSGGVNISIKGVLSPAAENQISKTLKGKAKTTFKTEMELRRFQEARKDCPSVKRTLFEVPQLCLELDGFAGVASEDLYMENGWRLSEYPAELPGFQIKEENDRWMIDLQGGRVIEQHIGKDHAELNLDDIKTPWTEDQLVGWLDAHLNQPDLSQSDLCLFIRNTVRHLNDERGINYATQQRFIFLLQKVFADRISDCRKYAQKKGFQTALFASDSSVCTREEFQYTFTPDSYPAHRHYTGSYQFKNHYFPIVGELKNEGEEFECAKAIDQNPQIEFWVRNLERRDSCAFSLPVSTGRFYPDFIAKLKNGNVMVIEYKGDMLIDKKSELEKEEVGKLWERKSSGKGLFLFAVKRDDAGRDVTAQIREKISKSI